MDTIGVREARQNLSTYLDRVKAGESLTITEHGRPVALLGPIPPDDDPWAELVAAGVMEASKGPFVPPATPARKPGQRLLSEVLQEMRDEDDR